jgi:hypothetical protein
MLKVILAQRSLLNNNFAMSYLQNFKWFSLLLMQQRDSMTRNKAEKGALKRVQGCHLYLRAGTLRNCGSTKHSLR